jgi:glycosyltransferase involved in cell wall biosynthesis
MRIAFLIGTLEFGGSEIQTCRLAMELTAVGHEVTVLALSKAGPLTEALTEAGVTWRSLDYAGLRPRAASGHLQPWRVPAQFLKLLRLVVVLRRLHVEVLHANLFSAVVWGIPAAAIAGVPVRVSGRRGLPPASAPWVRRLALRVTNRWAHRVVANCKAVADAVRIDEGLRDDQIIEIPNGVDIPPARTYARIARPTFVVVANLIAYKGHADVLAALASLDDPPVVRLLGDGPERARLVRLAAELELGTDVLVFEGAVRNVGEILQEVDAAILASHEEGLPNAVLEAMAAGLPVIATDVGGVSELVTDGIEGLLVAPSSPRELARAIERLRRDAPLRARLGQNGRRRAASFRWEACRDSHLALYRTLSKAVRARPREG